MLVTALEIAAMTAGYLAAGTLVMRWAYQRVRPWREPLNCQQRRYHSYGHYVDGENRPRDKHVPRCYRRYSDLDTTRDAMLAALTGGFFWPFLVLGISAVLAWRVASHALTRVVTAGAPDLPEELAARGTRDIRAVAAEDVSKV